MTAEAEANVLITLDEVASAGRTALYRLRDAAMDLLYIGISDDPIARMKQHAREQSWWPEVAHKSVVWYATREAADTAETIAIGLEQPKHNKAKRYVRLPEQAFPADYRTARRIPKAEPSRQVATAQLAPRDGGEFDGTEPPYWWAPDMWCRTWWERHGRGWCDPDLGFEDVVGSSCGKLDATEALGFLMMARKEHIASGYRGARVWWQDDSSDPFHPFRRWDPESSDRAQEGLSYSAHFDHAFGPNCISQCGKPDVILKQVQQEFLDALVAAGRCTRITSGYCAVAWGFRDRTEAAVTGVLLELLSYGHVELVQACTEAIQRQAPPTLLGDRG